MRGSSVVVVLFVFVFSSLVSAVSLPWVDVYYTNYEAALTLSSVSVSLLNYNVTGGTSTLVESLPMAVCGGGSGWFYVRIPFNSNGNGVQFSYKLSGVQYLDQVASQAEGDCLTPSQFPYAFDFSVASVFVNHPAAPPNATSACYGGQIATDSVNWNEHPAGTTLNCPLTTVFYYHNHPWFYDSNVNSVQIWQINGTGVASQTTLTRCSLIDDYWIGQLTLAPGVSKSNIQYVPVALNASGSALHYDNMGCTGGVNYNTLDFTQAATRLYVPYTASCGGSVITGYEGRYTTNPAQCAAQKSPTVPYTIFYYQNNKFYGDTTYKSYYVRVQQEYGSYIDITLLKCSALNYFVAFIAQTPNYQSADSWILPFASTTYDTHGTLLFDTNGCSSGNNYNDALDFAAQNNLLTTTNPSGCGGTMTWPTSASLGYPCGQVYSTYFQYRNPSWSLNPAIKYVAASVYDPISVTSYQTELVRTSSTCWAGWLQTVDLQAPSTQPVFVNAYDTNVTAILRDPCASGVLNPDFTNPLIGVDAEDPCGGIVTIGILPCPSVTPSPTPTPTPTTTIPTAGPTSTPTASGSAANSSTTLIIGVVVGVGGALILLLLLLLILFCRQRRRTQSGKADDELNNVMAMDERSLGANPSRSTMTTQVLAGASYAAVEYRKPNPAQVKEWQSNATVLNTTGEISLPGFLRMSIDQLQLVTQIGGGGNGAVQHARVVDPDWVAKNQRHRDVAAKQVPGNNTLTDEVNSVNFLQEVAAMNALRFHANIITLLGYCENPRYIITPLHSGDLHDYLMLKGPFKTRPAPWTTLAALEIADQIASALDTVHAFNIIHRDVKTKNIVLEEIDPSQSAFGFPFKARLIDFGIARLVLQEQHDDIKGMGFVNVVGLSTRYAAPEVFAAVQLAKTNGHVDPEQEKKGDIYAFGIGLWEMVFEEIPWRSLSNDEINIQVCDGKRPTMPENYAKSSDGKPESEVRVALLTIIERCWTHVAKQRPTTGVVSDELSALVNKFSKR